MKLYLKSLGKFLLLNTIAFVTLSLIFDTPLDAQHLTLNACFAILFHRLITWRFVKQN